MPGRLQQYRAKRNFAKTPEPVASAQPSGPQLDFVIQKHAASHLHYDFRLELNGVMRSWAIPKGPSYDPKVRRLAVQVEDHPVSYNAFEGTIPAGQYGAGAVIIWDRGFWQPVGDPRKALAAGKLLFTLHGEKMHGQWELVRIKKTDEERKQPWLLFKKHDQFERSSRDFDVVAALPDSVSRTQRTDKANIQITKAPRRVARAKLPVKLAPQLATLVSAAPTSGEWIYELKFDGYRMMTRIENGNPRLFTRGGHDWSAKMPVLLAELSKLGVTNAWLDGEVVIMGTNGAPDFNLLQSAFEQEQTQDVVYFVFDLPFCNDQDLRRVPLQSRRERLQELLAKKTLRHIKFSENFAADPQSLLHSACKMQLEGIIAKRIDAPYVSRRSDSWLKLKCSQRGEFFVGGFTDRVGSTDAAEIGSLLLGKRQTDGSLMFVGGVGTGWSAATSAELKQRLLKLEITKSPFSSPAPVRQGRWVQPTLIADVSFAEWTRAHQLRQATFRGIKNSVRKGRDSATGNITHPGRVIDRSTGLTKLEVVRYYESVADWMLPHLRDRPCSLVRAPAGVEGKLFFQKHLDKLRIPDAKALAATMWPGHAALLTIPTARALVGAAQINTLEFHTWNGHAGNLIVPDRIIFDLDPGEGVPWPRVSDAALLVRGLLKELGLQSWLKTSGGRGLHVVVPLSGRYDWASLKAFSARVVQQLARVIPNRFVAKAGPRNRVGKIFVDYLRNAEGATTVAAYSARARPGLGVSMPIEWEALKSVKSGAQWTIHNAREHLSFAKTDPWADYSKCKQSLATALKTLDAP